MRHSRSENFQNVINKLILIYRRKPSYTIEALKNAVEAVRAKRMSVRAAAQQYEIPFSCLQRHKDPDFNLAGAPTVLNTQEERDIVEWLLEVSRRGFPLSPSELKDSVKTMLDLRGRTTTFIENRPGRTWFKRFLQRNESLRIRLAENLDKSRASVTEENIRGWFAEVRLPTMA